MRVIFGLGLAAMAVIATPVVSEAQPESTYQLVLDLHIVPGQNAAFEALELARNTKMEAAGVTFPARMALQEGLPAVYRKTHFGLANQAALDTSRAQTKAESPSRSLGFLKRPTMAPFLFPSERVNGGRRRR